MKKTITYIIFFFSITIYAQETATTDYEYDNLNRLIKVVFNGDKEKNYVYDDLGNRIGLSIETLSISSETLKNTITVYPNPTDSFLTIKLPENLTNKNVVIKLYDINGKVITNHNTEIKENSALLDVKKLSKGVYLLHLISNNKNWSQIFIKK
jgi:YD repeat-containing protein